MSAGTRRGVVCISLCCQMCAKAITAAIRAQSWSWGYLWLLRIALATPSAATTWPTTTAPVGV